MTDEQKAAFVMAQAACMLARIESMKAANIMRQDQGHTIAYDEAAFENLEREFLVGHNAVIDFFWG